MPVLDEEENRPPEPEREKTILEAHIEKQSAKAAESGAVAFAVAGYAVCSATMLVCNKVAVHVLPVPSLVLFAQLLSAAVSVWLVGAAGLITVDALEWGKVKAFAPVALAFLGVIFANIKTLQYANVETFIIFRASTPLLISIADYCFLGRQMPDCRSWLALGGLLLGAAGYVYTDSSVEVDGGSAPLSLLSLRSRVEKEGAWPVVHSGRCCLCGMGDPRRCARACTHPSTLRIQRERERELPRPRGSEPNGVTRRCGPLSCTSPAGVGLLLGVRLVLHVLLRPGWSARCAVGGRVGVRYPRLVPSHPTPPCHTPLLLLPRPTVAPVRRCTSSWRLTR